MFLVYEVSSTSDIFRDDIKLNSMFVTQHKFQKPGITGSLSRKVGKSKPENPVLKQKGGTTRMAGKSKSMVIQTLSSKVFTTMKMPEN